MSNNKNNMSTPNEISGGVKTYLEADEKGQGKKALCIMAGLGLL